MEDLEDYFHRVDARRAEIEAEMATDGERKEGKYKNAVFVFSFGQYLMYIFGFKITYEVKGLIFCKLLSSSSFLLSSLPRICGRSLAKSVQYPRSYGLHSASLRVLYPAPGFISIPLLADQKYARSHAAVYFKLYGRIYFRDFLIPSLDMLQHMCHNMCQITAGNELITQPHQVPANVSGR